MGVQSLFDLLKDRRTPAQKLRDRVVDIAAVAVVCFLMLAGVIQIYHWIVG